MLSGLNEYLLYRCLKIVKTDSISEDTNKIIINLQLKHILLNVLNFVCAYFCVQIKIYIYFKILKEYKNLSKIFNMSKKQE